MGIHQRRTHPRPVEGCDACRWSSVGVQTLQIREGADPVRHVPVVAEEGPRAGRVVGEHVQHWDGRQDATVHAPAVAMKARVSEE